MNSSRAPVSLFYNSSKAAAGKTEAIVHIPFGPDARAAGRYSSSSGDRHSSSTVVDLVSPYAQRSITVSHSACDPGFLTAIPIGVGVYFGDICLAGAGSE